MVSRWVVGQEKEDEVAQLAETLFTMGPVYAATIPLPPEIGLEATVLAGRQGIVADFGENVEKAVEMEVRWNEYPVLYCLLRSLCEYGPVKKWGDDYIVPVGMVEGNSRYICWACGAMEGEVHGPDCWYATVAELFENTTLRKEVKGLGEEGDG